MNTQENDIEEKSIKKYSIHQKISTRMLGIEIFNQNIAVPYSAYLICKLIYKEDIQSFNEIDEIIFELQADWESEYQDIFIKNIHVFTAERYFLLTFSLGFFQKNQEKNLPKLKEWVKNKVKNYTNVSSKRMLMENDLLKKISTQMEQMRTKIDNVENRIQKNEKIVIDSNKKVQEEVKQINHTLATIISKRNESLEIECKDIVNKQTLKKNEHHSKDGDSLSVHIDTPKHENKKKRNNFRLVRGKKVKKIITEWKSISSRLKEMQIKNSSEVDKVKKQPQLSEYERKIVYYFTEVKVSKKQQIIPKKKFLEWQAKIEFIDYLWKMFESEKQSELVIAEKLNCKNLIEELPLTLAAVERISQSTKLFNYWIYCPQKNLVKLKGYVVLAEYLASILDNTETIFMVS